MLSQTARARKSSGDSPALADAKLLLLVRERHGVMRAFAMLLEREAPQVQRDAVGEGLEQVPHDGHAPAVLVPHRDVRDGLPRKEGLG